MVSPLRVLVVSSIALGLGGAPLSSQTVRKPETPAPSKPDCLVSDVAPTARPDSTGIADDTRRAIYAELQQAVARAKREAAAAYPTAEGGAMLSPTNVQKDSKLAAKRAAMERSLERSYVQDVLTKRSLGCAAAREIARDPTLKPQL